MSPVGPENTIGDVARPRAMRWAPAAIVAAGLATAIVWWPALDSKAQWVDDDEYFTNNPLVQHPTWSGAWRVVGEVRRPSTVAGYYQPLTMLSLMLDSALGATAEYPRIFHATSLALHTLNAMLVALLIGLLLAAPAGRRAAGSVVIAASLAGVLWGIHPMMCETITWISERKTPLAAFFGLQSLVAYAVAVGWAGPRRRRAWMVYSILAFFLSLAAKPTLLLLPVVLLLLDVWPLRRTRREGLVVEKATYFAVAVVWGTIAFVSQAQRAMAELPHGGTAGLALISALYLPGFYLAKLCWPTELTPYYSAPWPFSLSNPAVFGPALLTMVVVGLLIVARRSRAVLVCAAIVLAMLSPMAGLVRFSNFIAADKYVYLPLAGIMLLIAAGLVALQRRGEKGKVLAQLALGIGFPLLACFEALASQRQIKPWRSTAALYDHAISISPDDYILRFNHGGYLLSQGQQTQAVDELRLATSLAPWYAPAQQNLGSALVRCGRLDAAVAAYREALRLDPSLELARANLRKVLSALGEGSRLEALRGAVSKRPQDAEARFELAKALAAAELRPAAIEEYEAVLKLQPDHAAACGNLGILLAEAGRNEEALKLFQRAAALSPNSAEAHNNLGVCLQDLGREAEALGEYQRAVALRPDYVEAHYNLGSALEAAGRTDEALDAYRTVLKLDPAHARARRRLEEIPGR